MESTNERLRKIENVFLRTLKEKKIDFIRNGAADKHVPGNVSVSFRGISGEMILHRLDLKKIYISTGSACDSKNTQISHVIKAIAVPEEYAYGTIRVSFGKQNTLEDARNVGIEIAKILHAE